MDDGSRLPWIIAVLLLLAAAYFAVAETAFASASRPRLKAAAERGDRRAETALFVLDHFDRAITTLLICTNAVHLAAAALVTEMCGCWQCLPEITLTALMATFMANGLGSVPVYDSLRKRLWRRMRPTHPMPTPPHRHAA